MRLLSNIIKSQYVYVNGDDKKVIDSNGRSEILRTIHFNRQLHELPGENEIAVTEEHNDGSFLEGLKAIKIDAILSEEEKDRLKQQGEIIISDAQKQAVQILEQAEVNGKKTSELLYEEARKLGYEDGLRKGQSEVQQAKQELEELLQKQTKDYLEQIESLEPQFVDIVSNLIERITGIVVEDKKEVILYLIHNAMIHADSSQAYTIKVSKDEYEFMLSKKEELTSYISGEIMVEVILDKGLDKNQCLIVTDTRIINCSLDVQLSNLIQDLKLLSNKKE